MMQRIVKGVSLDFFYRYRGFLVLVFQLMLIIASYEASFLYAYRTSFFSGSFSWMLALKTLPLLIFVRMSIIHLFHLNQDSWRYTDLSDLAQIIKATTVSTLVFIVLVILFFGLSGFPRSTFLLDWTGNILLLSGARFTVRYIREQYIRLQNQITFKHLLIIGTSDVEVSICKQALSIPGIRLKPVAFLDNDTKFHRTTKERIVRVPVYGSSTDLAKIVTKHRVDIVVAAVPSTKPAELKVLTEQCQNLGVQFMVIPEPPAYLERDISIYRMREVTLMEFIDGPEAKFDSD